MVSSSEQCRFPEHRLCTREERLCELCDPEYASLVERVREKWNDAANRWNTWGDLGQDEKDELIQAEREGRLQDVIDESRDQTVDAGTIFYVVMLKRKDGQVLSTLAETDCHIYFSREEAQAMVRDPERQHVVRMIAFVEEEDSEW